MRGLGYKIVMTLARTTKNTYRYESSDEDSIMRTLYVQQTAFPGGPPESIEVTIEDMAQVN